MAKVQNNNDDCLQDYMMVLEVFDKIEPGEQGVGGSGGTHLTQQQGALLNNATADAFDAGSSGFAADGNIFGQSIAGGTLGGYSGSTGRNKRGGSSSLGHLIQ